MPYLTGSWGIQAKERSRKRNEYFKNYLKLTRGKLKKRVFDKLGNKCASCGLTEIEILQIDHVENDGANERRSKMNMRGFYYKVLRDKENRYQLLCPNCNWRKFLKTKGGN